MIEKTVLNYLTTACAPVPVKMEVPPNPPEAYYVVEKTGSGIEDHIKSATIAIKSVAPSLYEAAVMNETVKEKMDSIISLDSICKCTLNSDYPFSDPETKNYRYQCVYDLIHY